MTFDFGGKGNGQGAIYTHASTKIAGSSARGRFTMRPHILIVEDDKKIAATIKLYLEHAGYETALAYDGRAALELSRAKRFDLIILDLMLPGIDGLELCRTLRLESDVYIIMLTARTTEQDKLRGLDTGADDYVTKPFSPRELVARVRAVLRRRDNRHFERGPAELCFRDLVIDLKRHEVRLQGKTIYLTPKEFKLLETFARSPERAFTREELVERAFGDDYEGLDRTIDAHIMNLRKKIEPDRMQPSFIVTVYGVGYKFSTECDAS
jgi:DNA-binding response OmpR family regulator